jgi:hypothetical protein
MDGQDQVEMGEGVAHLADIRQSASAGASPPCAVPGVAGKPKHPAQKALVGAAFQQQRAVAVADPDLPWRVGFSGFGGLARQVGGNPVARAVQMVIQGQIAQAGLRGVQIVAPRSITACA